MRGLAFALVASCLFWGLLTWCTVYTAPMSGTMPVCWSDLLASVAFIGLAVIVVRLTAVCFGDHEADDAAARDRLHD